MRLVQRLVLKYIRTKFKILSTVSKKKAAAKAFRLFCTPQLRNKKSLPSVFEKAERLHFSLENNTVRGFRWQHPSQKKVLILHGFESSVVNFEKYVKPLMQNGYEVLAFDAPAHGRSSGKSITVLTYKKMVQYILGHYGPVHSFIAHSFGGLGLSLALEDIPHDDEWKVVLIAPAAETTTAIDHFFKFLELDEGVRLEFDKLITKVGGTPPNWYSVSRVAGLIKAQVLFLQDKDDLMTPMKDVLPIMERNYPNFHFVITEGLGHRRIYRDSRVSQQIIDFL